MGEVIETITIANQRDKLNALYGVCAESDIRQTTVEALVDTGAGTLVITDAVRERLGLKVSADYEAVLAGNARQKCAVAESVAVCWKDREAVCNPIVLPDGDEILLGVIPLEAMDLMVNPVERRLVGAHGDKQVFMIR